MRFPLEDISRNKPDPRLTELFYNACVLCSCKEQGDRREWNLHFARKRNMSSSPMKAKLPGNHLLLQGLVKINLSCPEFSCVWCIVYDEPDRMLCVFLLRSLIHLWCRSWTRWRVWYHQRASWPWRWPWVRSVYRISFLSLSHSLSSFSSFLFYLSLFFIYLCNVHKDNNKKTKNRDRRKRQGFSHDKSSRTTSKSNCSGVTLWTEHHLFTLLISRRCNVYHVLEIWRGIDPVLTWEQLSWPDSGLFNRNESQWLFGNGHCKCCLMLGEGLCWVIAWGPDGYQVKATWWQAGWWLAPENEKVITVSGSVKY